MATIHSMLASLDFNFKKGSIIVYQASTSTTPGWSGSDQIDIGIEIKKDHPILFTEFYSGYGGPMCPRFIAKDKEAIYFPCQYDGATWVEKIYTNLSVYTDPNCKVATPYPGG